MYFAASDNKRQNHVKHRRDGVVIRASASQSVDFGFIPFVELYQKTLKNGIHSFPAWRTAFSGGCGEQAQVRLLCPWARHLTGRPHLYVEDRWPSFPSEERVGDRKGIRP